MPGIGHAEMFSQCEGSKDVMPGIGHGECP